MIVHSKVPEKHSRFPTFKSKAFSLQDPAFWDTLEMYFSRFDSMSTGPSKLCSQLLGLVRDIIYACIMYTSAVHMMYMYIVPFYWWLPLIHWTRKVASVPVEPQDDAFGILLSRHWISVQHLQHIVGGISCAELWFKSQQRCLGATRNWWGYSTYIRKKGTKVFPNQKERV